MKLTPLIALIILTGCSSQAAPKCSGSWETVVSIPRTDYRTIYVETESGKVVGLYTPRDMRPGKQICIMEST